jgi:uncharacterized protein with WD repeat
LEDGAQHKNLRIFSVCTGEELVSFSQKSQDGWDLQYTISESHAVRLVGQDIHVFHPAEWSKGIVDKLKVEGATSVSLSPGLNPSIAVFVAEKKASVLSVYGNLSSDCLFEFRALRQASKFMASARSAARLLARSPSTKLTGHKSSGTRLAHRYFF